MKLNPDCIRDILLDIEEITTPSISFFYPSTSDQVLRTSAYSQDEVSYHLIQCYYENLLIGFREYNDGSYQIDDLSPDGHQFLGSIRSDNIWTKIKPAAISSGIYSLKLLIPYAINYIM